MDDESALDEVNEAANDLLLLFEELGVQALLITLQDNTIVVRCQNKRDVLPLCSRVVEEYDAPESRVLN